MTLPINYRHLRWLSLSDVASGSVFCSTHSIEGSYWPFISEVVAEKYECDADDLITPSPATVRLKFPEIYSLVH